MDVVTQGVLGAAVGHVVLGRRIGMKAMALGFAGGILPDLDVLLVADARSLDYWYHHRGITHSLLFGPVVGLALAAVSRAVDRWRQGTTPLGLWYVFWLLVLVTHPLLDLATHWGTAIFMPFSEVRYGVPAISVIDPVYTLLLLAGLGLALAKGVSSVAARQAVLCALALSSLYVGLGWGQNLRAERLAAADLAARDIAVSEVHAYTGMFSPWLRRLVAVTPEAHLVGFVSTLRPHPIEWTAVPRDPEAEALGQAIAATAEARVYTTFANGPIHAQLQPRPDEPGVAHALRLYDLRYGFPGQGLTGFWGMEARLDGDGRLVEASRFRVPRTIEEGDLVAMARAKLGLPQEVF